PSHCDLDLGLLERQRRLRISFGVCLNKRRSRTRPIRLNSRIGWMDVAQISVKLIFHPLQRRTVAMFRPKLRENRVGSDLEQSDERHVYDDQRGDTSQPFAH